MAKLSRREKERLLEDGAASDDDIQSPDELDPDDRSDAESDS